MSFSRWISPRVSAAVAVAAVAAAAMPVVTHARADANTFRDTALPGSGGGEPSLSIDTGQTASQNDMYVTRIGSNPALWHSYDGGQTWPAAVPYHQTTSGCQPSAFGDEDVLALPNGNVVVAHLNVTNNDVQVSTDHGQSFGNCTSVGAESDRQWFGNSGSSNVYLAYHDFVGEVPIICTSVTGGTAFPVCNQAFTNPQVAQCAENTVMARPVVVDPTDGSINIPYSCSTAAENATNPPYGPLHDYYLAKSVSVVAGVPTTFTTTTIFQASTSGLAPNFANIFSTLRIDSAGNYYLEFAGTPDDNHVLSNPYHVYLTTSTDHGSTWSTPKVIDSEADGKGTHVLPDMYVTGPGQVDIVWLSAYDPTTGADVTGEPNGQCGSTTNVHNCMDGTQNVGMAPGGPVQANWKVVMAQSTNALTPTPTWTYSQVSPGSMHSGEICTNGIVCGSSDRSLLDYISLGIDCSGNAHMAYADNFGHALQTHEADQTGGTTVTPPATCGTASVVTPEAPYLPVLVAGGAAAAVAVGVRRLRRRDAPST